MGRDSEILGALRSGGGHIAVEDLARRVGLDSATLLGRIEELRRAGYDIEQHPHLGIRLLAAPDRLVADDLEAMLGGEGIARQILVFEETSSTNDVVLELGRQGEAEGLVVFAEHQTSGRGRLGRRWLSAVGKGLWFSVLLRPTLDLSKWPRLTLAAAVAVARAIEGQTGLNPQIKWPNDIFLQGRKVAGILLESRVEPGTGGLVVVGIGVNVNQGKEEFPPEIADSAGSLSWFRGGALRRDELAVAILRELEPAYRAAAQHVADLVEEGEKRSFLRGKRVKVQAGRTAVSGVVTGLDGEGALLIRKEDGAVEKVESGETNLEIL